MNKRISNEEDPGMSSRVDENLLDRGVMILNGPISENHLYVCASLLEYHCQEDFEGPLNIFICSDGGLTGIAWSIIDMINSVNFKVNTIAMGEVASCAVDVLMAGSKRYSFPNASFLLHPHSAQREGNFYDLKANFKFDQIEFDRHINHLIKNTKYTTKKQILDNLVSPTDLWLSAKEALNHGIIDEIISSIKFIK